MEYLAKNNPLFEIESIGLNITWTLIELGLFNSINNTSYLNVDKIIQYMEYKVFEQNSTNEEFISLICIKDSDEEIKKLIKKYSQMEGADKDIQLKKWIVVGLKRKLDMLSDRVVDGLMDLTEFWLPYINEKWCPHKYHNLNNCDINPSEYFTQENYNKLIKANINWINSQIQLIHKLEKM